MLDLTSSRKGSGPKYMVRADRNNPVELDEIFLYLGSNQSFPFL